MLFSGWKTAFCAVQQKFMIALTSIFDALSSSRVTSKRMVNLQAGEKNNCVFLYKNSTIPNCVQVIAKLKRRMLQCLFYRKVDVLLFEANTLMVASTMAIFLF